MTKIVIAAGGTAGHVVPALAIADELRAEGADVAFIGAEGRVGAELVTASGYPLYTLRVSGLARRNPARAALAVLRSVGAIVSSLRILRRLRPEALLAMGGYAAGPAGVAALLTGTPLVLAESDSRLGLSNRLLARFARRVCLAFPLAGREAPRYLVTGRPVARAFFETQRSSARDRLGIEQDARCVLVFGGSQGARSLNACVVAAFAQARPPGVDPDSPPVVLHVAGHRDYRELAARVERAGWPAHYRLYEYFQSLADPLAAADLVVARAGASVFELAAAGKPSVLVPLPHATGGHQLTNARWLTDAGAAVVVLDHELDAVELSRLVGELLHDPERLSAMGTAARALARPEAANQVAGEVLAVARARNGGEHPTGRSGGAEAVADRGASARDGEWRGRRLHFVGIGGAGMSGLALVARRLGAEVTGCDRAEGPYTALLREAGIEPAIGHAAEHVERGMEVVASTAVPVDMPELQAARELGATILRRGTLLAQVAALRRLIAVAGTHGKTTTAAMTAHCLGECGADPSYLVGGELRGVDGSQVPHARWGAGAWLVAEADESDRSFLELSPQIAVVTNVELDHHTTYGSLLELEQAFRSFLDRLPPEGTAVVWNRPSVRALVPPSRALLSFGVQEAEADGSRGEGPRLEVRALVPAGLGTTFELVRDGEPVCRVELGVPGRHNVLNALAALGACEAAGFDLRRAARSLAGFRGPARRFEQKGAAGGVRIFDDYAHHPTELAATLEAARALEPVRLLAVFQPHLYSRTLRLHRELGQELARADVAVVVDVYPAREQPEGELAGVTGKLVADACADNAGGRPVWWLPTLEEAEDVLARQLSQGDLLITIGAGDVDRLATRLAARIANGELLSEGVAS